MTLVPEVRPNFEVYFCAEIIRQVMNLHALPNRVPEKTLKKTINFYPTPSPGFVCIVLNSLSGNFERCTKNSGAILALANLSASFSAMQHCLKRNFIEPLVDTHYYRSIITVKCAVVQLPWYLVVVLARSSCN